MYNLPPWCASGPRTWRRHLQCGFAGTQAAYDKDVSILFNSLDRADKLLGTRRYLAGSVMTISDVRLYVTLCRFDMVRQESLLSSRVY